MLFKKENILPDNELYRRLPRGNYNSRRERFSSSAFKLRKKEKSLAAISVNWDRHSTPENSSICPRTKQQYDVGAIKACIPIREGLEVVHKPSNNMFYPNQAHSLIRGKRLVDSELEITEIFAKNCRAAWIPK